MSDNNFEEDNFEYPSKAKRQVRRNRRRQVKKEMRNWTDASGESKDDLDSTHEMYDVDEEENWEKFK